MDSQFYGNLIEDSNYIKRLIEEPVEPDDLDAISFVIGITRDFHEVNRHFEIFLFDLEEFFNHYDLRYDGYITKHLSGRPADKESDYIAVNALIRGIISSGRILVDAMQSLFDPDGTKRKKSKSKNKDKSNENQSMSVIDYPLLYLEKQDKNVSCASKEFFHFISNIYDRNWTYQLWYELRNYSQHLHLPVNRLDAVYFIDYDVIVNKPRYNMKTSVEKSMNKSIQMSKDDRARYGIKTATSLGFDLVEYTRCVLSVCIKFYECIAPALRCAMNIKKTVISKYMWRIVGGKFFIYKYETGSQQDNGLGFEYYLDTDANGRVIGVIRGVMRGTDLDMNILRDLDKSYKTAEIKLEKYASEAEKYKEHMVKLSMRINHGSEQPNT